MMKKDVYQEILNLSNKGELLLNNQQYEDAILKFEEALALIPAPKTDYEAGSWLTIAIGDAYFLLNDFEKALSYFKHGEIYPKGLNPFNWLRIGQCYFELRNKNAAREYLIKAYAMEGDEIFEEEDEKYLEVIKDLI